MAFGNVTRKFANETWHFEKDCSTCWVKSAAFLPSRGLLTRLSSLCAENRNLWEEVPPTPTCLHSLDEALPPAPSWCRCPLPWKKSSPRHSFPSGCPRFPKIVDKSEFLINQNKTHWPWRCCYGALQQGLPPRLYPLDLCKQKLFAHSVYTNLCCWSRCSRQNQWQSSGRKHPPTEEPSTHNHVCTWSRNSKV